MSGRRWSWLQPTALLTAAAPFGSCWRSLVHVDFLSEENPAVHLVPPPLVARLVIPMLSSSRSPALARVQASAGACMVARAQGAFRAATGHFAAVMGNAIESTLNPSLSSAWSVTGTIGSNASMLAAIRAVDGADPLMHDHLRSEIGMHIEWCLSECLDDLIGHL